MRTFKAIEKPSMILGMPVTDLVLVLVLLVAMVLLGAVLGIFMPVSKYYYLLSMLVIMVLLFVLRYFNRQQHPDFIKSFIAYHWLQAREIHLNNKNHHYAKGESC